jgi:hypothetical protein
VNQTSLFMKDGKDAIYLVREDDVSQLEGLFVCSQSHLAGASQRQDDQLVILARPECSDATNPMLAGSYAATAGLWTPAQPKKETLSENDYVDGWVWAAGERFYDADLVVMTAAGLLATELAFVEPITDWCYSSSSQETEDSLATQAFTVRDQMIPFGTPVRLFPALSQFDNSALVHRLGVDGGLRDGEPPFDSVNELLVKSGYWIPHITGVTDLDTRTRPSEREWHVSYTLDAPMAAMEAEYRQRIIDAGNQTRLAALGQIDACITEQSIYWDRVYASYFDDDGSDDDSSTVVIPAPADDTDSSAPEIGGSGSADRCYVSGHYRSGNWVSGYWRRC